MFAAVGCSLIAGVSESDQAGGQDCGCHHHHHHASLLKTAGVKVCAWVRACGRGQPAGLVVDDWRREQGGGGEGQNRHEDKARVVPVRVEPPR